MAQLEANTPDNECVIKGNISKGEKVYFMPFHRLYANVKIDPACEIAFNREPRPGAALVALTFRNYGTNPGVQPY